MGIACSDPRVIAGIHDDSRRVGRDWVFVARNAKAERYIEDALVKGAVVVCGHIDPQADVYAVEDVEQVLRQLIACCHPGLCEHVHRDHRHQREIQHGLFSLPVPLT